ADFIRWLRIVEDMLRPVLFIEAIAIATSLPPPTPPRASTSGARKPGPVFDLDDNNTWRPSFRMTPAASRAGIHTAKHIRQKPRTLVKTRPLALRMQALLEALHDPHRFIQRLARRLRSGLDRFRHLATSPRCFYALANPTLRHLSAECAPRFTDSS
ncbi:MAG: hypothetical protein Q8R82_03995, partial [Hyphomonadaceae bacterium]|nr:hypothetical protein [Hyphomonadaceae bacterium]